MHIERIKQSTPASLSAFLMRRRGLFCGGLLAIAVAVVATVSAPVAADTRCATDLNWVATWGASPSGAASQVFNDQSVRMIVRISVGGTKFRVKLSNLNNS